MLKVAFQGEPGAYSEYAAFGMFSSHIKTIPEINFEDVFLAVKEGSANRAVIPIENSLAGSIHQNYDLLQSFNLKIMAEAYLRVEHIFMCHPSTGLRSITQVRSHPQALSQCSNFFSRKRSITPYTYYDTAGAAKYVAEHESKHIGAIASMHAAKLYGLKVLKRNVENNHNNYTRFLGITRSQKLIRSKGRVKTSICITPNKEESGILFKILGVFAERGINLFKIESRPIPGRTFEYLFYLDFEGHPQEKHVASAMNHLARMDICIQVLGAYALCNLPGKCAHTNGVSAE